MHLLSAVLVYFDLFVAFSATCHPPEENSKRKGEK